MPPVASRPPGALSFCKGPEKGGPSSKIYLDDQITFGIFAS